MVRVTGDADFATRRRRDLAAERRGEQLVAEAYAEVGAREFQDPMANDGFLGREPGMDGLLPDVHGAAHHEQCRVIIQGWQGFAAVELDGIPGDAFGAHAVAKKAWMLDVEMLQNGKREFMRPPVRGTTMGSVVRRDVWPWRPAAADASARW